METTTTASRRATIPIHLDGMPDYASLIKPDRIHSSLYLSEQIFADEMKKLFYGGWVFVGHESEIPNPNDFITRMLGLEPVIMVRTREGEISVMSNRCSHRGNLVCPKETGSARAFTCDYHGWTFNQKGDLIGVPLNDDETRDRSCLGLQKPMQIGECGGFIFATYNPDSGPLSDYLGAAHDLIMRSVSLSPTGKIKLTAGWIKQQFRSNWKMLPENSTDGYHAPYVHSSFVRTFAPNTQYERLKDGERARSEAIAWGGGHMALEHGPAFETNSLQWLGRTEAQVPEYVAAMKAAYGEEEGARKMRWGPSHATVFPNLFLGEMNVVIFQPISVDECVLWSTPMLLDGVSADINTRLIRASQAALGPASFLLADDSVISERQQVALNGRGGWLDISRGMKREKVRDGAVVGQMSDETTSRGFWSHYLKAMQA